MKLRIKITALLTLVCMLIPMMFSSCGYKSKYAAVMEYNGIKLTEEMYYYWMSTYKRNILLSYDDAKDTPEFWNKPYDENRTIEEFFTEILNERIMNYLIAQDLYKKNNLKMSKTDKNAIKKDIAEKIEMFGGRSELNNVLSNLKLNIDGLEEIYLWESKHDLVYDFLFGEGGVLEISDSEIISYYENNYYQMSYAVFYTVKLKTDENGDYINDASGNPISEKLTEDEMKKKLETIAEFEEKMNSGEDFAKLIEEYSDFDTKNYPNGFFVSANEIDIWGLDIYNALKNAEQGKVTRVKGQEEIFFVKKLPLTDFSLLSDTDLTQLKNLSVYASSDAYDRFFSELSPKVKIYKDIMSKYKLSEITANPYYPI